jgi:hypothetical protein
MPYNFKIKNTADLVLYGLPCFEGSEFRYRESSAEKYNTVSCIKAILVKARHYERFCEEMLNTFLD